MNNSLKNPFSCKLLTRNIASLCVFQALSLPIVTIIIVILINNIFAYSDYNIIVYVKRFLTKKITY